MKRQRTALGAKHEQILCAIDGIRSTTARSVLYKQLGELPLSSNWLLKTMTFWNNIAALPDNYLFKTVALDNCHDAVLHKGEKLGLELSSSATNWAMRSPWAMSPCPLVTKWLYSVYCGTKWQNLFKDFASAVEQANLLAV